MGRSFLMGESGGTAPPWLPLRRTGVGLTMVKWLGFKLETRRRDATGTACRGTRQPRSVSRAAGESDRRGFRPSIASRTTFVSTKAIMSASAQDSQHGIHGLHRRVLLRARSVCNSLRACSCCTTKRTRKGASLLLSVTSSNQGDEESLTRTKVESLLNCRVEGVLAWQQI